MTKTGKTITYQADVYPVHKDSSGEYIVVDSDVRRVYIYLDTLRRLGLEREYDRTPFEDLSPGTYATGTSTNTGDEALAYAYIYQRTRDVWYACNSSVKLSDEDQATLRRLYESGELHKLTIAKTEDN